jgi:hypothetical protein
VRAKQVAFFPASESDPTGEIRKSQNAPSPPASPQDEVKVQWDKPDQMVIYQFVNQ